MKNRTILGIICLLGALLTVFGIAPLLASLTDSHTEVVRMVRSVEQGHQLTENDIELVEVGSYNLPSTVLADMKTVVGRYATVDLRPGDYVMESKLQDEAIRADDVFRTLNGDKRAVSVTVQSFAAGLSGKLENGDIVSVCVYSSTDKSSFLPPELSYVKVITATTGNGEDQDERTVRDDGTSDQIATVTLLVNAEQERLLVEYEKGASLHMALVFRGEKETAERFLRAQDAYFEMLHAPAEESSAETEESTEWED